MSEELKKERKTLQNGKGKTGKKLHGARRSKVDPKMMTVLQHEAHKLRIFKLTMGLFLACVMIGGVASLIVHIKNTRERNEYIAGQREKLRNYERTFSADKPYESAVAAAHGIRLAEGMLEMAYSHRDTDLEIEMQEDIKRYSKVVEQSRPVNGKNYVSPVCLFDMVWIAPGKFAMGTAESSRFSISSERPQREVGITKHFWMSRREVDVWQFRKLVPGFCMPLWAGIQLDKLNYPVGRVSWEEAMFFCQKLTSEERRRGMIPEGYEYRLPTEAEWEYCARAGTNTAFYWGNEFGKTGAIYANSLDRTAADKFGWKSKGEWGLAESDLATAVAPTGSFRSNAFGLYDMSGNVSEWCFDWYNPDFYKTIPEKGAEDVCNTTVCTVAYEHPRDFDAGTTTREMPCRVIRGGNWGNVPEKLRCAARDFMPPNEKNNGVGFRVVLAPVIPTKLSNAR